MTDRTLSFVADQSSKLAANLDRHLALPILEHAVRSTEAIKDSNPAAFKSLVEGLERTAQSTRIFALHKRFAATEKAAAAVDTRHHAFDQDAERLRGVAQPVLTHFFNFDDESKTLSLKIFHRQIDEMRKTQRIGALNLPRKAIDAVYDLGFLLCDAGAYDQAAQLLYVYQSVTSELADLKESPKRRSLYWGRLLCDCLSGDWRNAVGDIHALREYLDPTSPENTQNPTPLIWLLHWSLFYYFKRTPALDTMAFLDHITNLDVKAGERYRFVYGNALQSLCPHLLRYAAVAAILNKKKRAALRRVQRMCESEMLAGTTDPFIRFLDALSGSSDFKTASAILSEFDAAIPVDFFLADHKDEIINAARMMIFEESLRIHKSVSIPAAAKRLGMPEDRTEAWLVDVIQDAKFDATIDSVHRVVNVNISAHRKSIHQQVQDILESASKSHA